MILQIPFRKISGAGNDFILIDEIRFSGILSSVPDLARALCHRNLGIGADALLIMRAGGDTDFQMDYYNADGSTGGMCGNGARCMTAYYLDSRERDGMATFQALGDRYEGERRGEGISVHMKNPTGMLTGLTINALGKTIPCNFINTGSPHVVIFIDQEYSPFETDFETADIRMLGKAIRNHETFRPLGTNVNFVTGHREKGSSIKIRTYERGVENETLACGTGSIASAVLASGIYGIAPPVRIIARSGDTLNVNFKPEGNEITDVWLSGPVMYHFSGIVYYDTEKHYAGIDVYYNDISDKRFS
jgi:diaminopimelate epimerase